MNVSDLARKVLDGGRVSAEEALVLYREAPTQLLGHLADTIRFRKHPERLVTYIIDRNVNYTNLCVARCNFCAFYRPVGSADGYVLGFEEILGKIQETIDLAATSCCCRADTTRTCRSPGTKTFSVPSSRASRNSSSTRCRRRKCCTLRA
jgi:2-iminoacetate synthase ThiH